MRLKTIVVLIIMTLISSFVFAQDGGGKPLPGEGTPSITPLPSETPIQTSTPTAPAPDEATATATSPANEPTVTATAAAPDEPTATATSPVEEPTEANDSDVEFPADMLTETGLELE